MISALQFNISDALGRWVCPACGYPGYSYGPAYDESHGLAGMAICPCCLWEPGYDDEPLASADAEETILGSLRSYRASWCRERLWRGRETERPDAWDGAEQLRRLFDTAPHVR
ncbi:hypothetical protein EV667_3666 [Ancylobacter aquaticus]|uniref:Cysteine-rich CPCC domain-containing protein n=1 Tax=Ancylobacter aquaticus TaxID=100 RepID=A0A4R1HMU4_ANCAQ|nr:hypothetical protein EV667_3666 [Ancylobacter aquaticus]